MRVFVIEDNSLFLQLVTAMLTRLDHKVVGSCDHTADLLRQLRNLPEPPDILLFDNDCPEKGAGVGIEKLIMSRDTHPDKGFILMSGRSDSREDAIAEGVPFLKKPFEIIELCNAIEQLAPFQMA